MAIVKAEAVFNQEAGFNADELVRVMGAGAGKTVSFPRRPYGLEFTGTGPRAAASDFCLMVLSDFARGGTGDEVAKKHGMSRRQFFYILKRERSAELKGSRVEEWKGMGLSLREIGRLYGKSHETVRQAVGEAGTE